MKFLVIINSAGKRQVKEYDAPSFEQLNSKLMEVGAKDFRIFCEISDLVESLSDRVTVLEKKIVHIDSSIAESHDQNTNIAPDDRQHKVQPSSKSIRIELINKDLVLADGSRSIYQSHINFTLHVHNISNTKIRAVKGDLVFHDLFDAEIFRIGITMNNPIKPGKFEVWSGGFEYNEFLPEHVHFAGFNANDLTLTLDNEKIV